MVKPISVRNATNKVISSHHATIGTVRIIKLVSNNIAWMALIHGGRTFTGLPSRIKALSKTTL